MPTYRWYCEKCDTTFDRWESIHSTPSGLHDVCGEPGRRVYTKVHTLGVGVHGRKFLEVEAREARWAKDMPAYKRFRDRGLQPPQIDGCDYLEATAKNTLWVNSGGRIRVNEQQMIRAREMAEDIAAGRQ